MTLQPSYAPSRPRQWPWQRLFVAMLCLFAFGMSALVSRAVFERLPHLEDEVAYLYQARVFARGQLVVDTPEPRRSYWQPFVVDYRETGKRFGKYTPGWPALLAPGVVLGQPWVINAFFAALTVALAYRLGREIYGEDTGLMGAALAAFSPMALLLNGSLMGHTAALCCATAFMYAYWRLEKGRSGALRWAALAGGMLGLLVITRPLTAVGVALPFIAWSGLRVLAPLLAAVAGKPGLAGGLRRTWTVLRPLLALSAVTLIIALFLPIFNMAATGDPTQNLYELVWSYDRIGFGECCGRSGHTLEKGIRHARFDLSLTAADLFGWQDRPITPELEQHLLTSSSYWPATGYSFLLLPFGVVLGLLLTVRSISSGLRRLFWFGVWLAFAAFWATLPLRLEVETLREVSFAWLWLGVALGWVLLPLAVFAREQRLVTARWTWLLLALTLSIVLVQIAYWIGSQRYSTRYYFEALTAVSLLSALPLAWLAHRVRYGRWIVYPLLVLALAHSLLNYSVPRISVLRGFNFIDQQDIEDVLARRQDDRPILVIVNGPNYGEDRVRWRAMGTLMAVTSPFLDSEIVVAWDYDIEGTSDLRQRILERFPDRQVIEMQAAGNEATFLDEQSGSAAVPAVAGAGEPQTRP